MLNKEQVLNEMYDALTANLLEKWYPLCVDFEYGGYYTNLTHDMKLMAEHPKMVVTQARHIWTCAKAGSFLSNRNYLDYASHGLKFLEEKMWDQKYGGFFQLRSRDGSVSDVEGYFSEKRTYGNAFAVYALAALYEAVHSDQALESAVNTFRWIEEHSYDPELKGYFQFLTEQGIVYNKKSDYKTKASDEVEVGYKDQNSSIHLLEAYTELYEVWKNDDLKKQLNGLLELIRDVITDEKGYLRLFFENDWTPVSFRDSSAKVQEKNYRLDHVSFGHDYETAFLMLEASHVLGIKEDVQTLKIAKRMIDHAINNGWDKSSAGFFDEGYYFKDSPDCTIIKDTKNWWAQAEGLNALLLFSRIFPEEKRYYELFLKQWEYVKNYLIDYENGDWYWGSLEKEPFYKSEPKGSIWKGTYHNGRALMNCIAMLVDENDALYENEGIKLHKKKFDNMIKQWMNTSRLL